LCAAPLRNAASLIPRATSLSLKMMALCPPIKKMAGYHQFHTINMTIEQSLRASMEKGKVFLVPRS
jgi:hypothetical protein